MRWAKAIEGYRYALAHGNLARWHAHLAAVYVETGDMAKAAEQSRLYLSKRPTGKIADLTEILRIQDPERTKHYQDLLRKAGIPE